jgi:hypothetical protein
MSTAPWVALILALFIGGVLAADHAELRVRRAIAAKCATEAHATGAPVRDCYTSRELIPPEAKNHD